MAVVVVVVFFFFLYFKRCTYDDGRKYDDGRAGRHSVFVHTKCIKAHHQPRLKLTLTELIRLSTTTIFFPARSSSQQVCDPM
jgi:hypothetical protein